jgi:hypothetical protein
MGKPTFRSFNDVVRELEDVYGHQELWLYSGLNEDCPVETARRRQEWRSPKILETAEWWQNNQASLSSGCSPETTICRSLNTAVRRGALIDKVFKLYCSLF